MCDKDYRETVSNQVIQITLEDCCTDDESRICDYSSENDDDSKHETDEDLLCDECKKEVEEYNKKYPEDIKKISQTVGKKCNAKKFKSQSSCSFINETKQTKSCTCKTGIKNSTRLLLKSGEQNRKQKCDEEKTAELNYEKVFGEEKCTSLVTSDDSLDERRFYAEKKCDFKKSATKKTRKFKSCSSDLQDKCSSETRANKINHRRIINCKENPKHHEKNSKSCDSAEDVKLSRGKHVEKRDYDSCDCLDHDADGSGQKRKKKVSDCGKRKSIQQNESICSCKVVHSLKKSISNQKFHEKNDKTGRKRPPAKCSYNKDSKSFDPKKLKNVLDSCERLTQYFDETKRKYEMSESSKRRPNEKKEPIPCFSETKSKRNDQKRSNIVENSTNQRCHDIRESQFVRKRSQSCDSTRNAESSSKCKKIKKILHVSDESFDISFLEKEKNKQMKRDESCKRKAKESTRREEENSYNLKSDECCSHQKSQEKSNPPIKNSQNWNSNKTDDHYAKKNQDSGDSDIESYGETCNMYAQKESRSHGQKDSDYNKRLSENCESMGFGDIRHPEKIKIDKTNHNYNVRSEKNEAKNHFSFDRSKWPVCEKCKKRKDPKRKTKKDIYADKMLNYLECQFNSPVQRPETDNSEREQSVGHDFSSKKQYCGNHEDEETYQYKNQKACKYEKGNKRSTTKTSDRQRHLSSEPKKDCQENDNHLPIRFKQCKGPVCRTRVENNDMKEDECDSNYVKVREICERLKDIRKQFSANKRSLRDTKSSYESNSQTSFHKNNQSKCSLKCSEKNNRKSVSQACQTEFVCKCDQNWRKSNHCQKEQALSSDIELTKKSGAHPKYSELDEFIISEKETPKQRQCCRRSKDSSKRDHEHNRTKQCQNHKIHQMSSKQKYQQENSCQRKCSKQRNMSLSEHQPDMCVLKCTSPSTQMNKLRQKYSLCWDEEKEHAYEPGEFIDGSSREELLYISNCYLRERRSEDEVKDKEIARKYQFDKDFEMYKKNLKKNSKKQTKSAKLKAKIEKYCNCTF